MRWKKTENLFELKQKTGDTVLMRAHEPSGECGTVRMGRKSTKYDSTVFSRCFDIIDRNLLFMYNTLIDCSRRTKKKTGLAKGSANGFAKGPVKGTAKGPVPLYSIKVKGPISEYILFTRMSARAMSAADFDI